MIRGAVPARCHGDPEASGSLGPPLRHGITLCRHSQKAVALRGLNKNHHDLKWIFKSASVRASRAAGPLHWFYQRLLAKGRKPALARLTLARKTAAITLTVWKKGVRFDAQHLKPQAA